PLLSTLFPYTTLFRSVVVPNVLADRKADVAAVELDRLILRGRLEIPVFVKNVVGRQQRLDPGSENLSVLKKSHGIGGFSAGAPGDRKSTRLNSSHVAI